MRLLGMNRVFCHIGRFVIRFGCLFILFTSTGSFQSALAEEGRNQIYVIDYSKGDSWQQSAALEEQAGYSKHKRYLRQLFDSDVLIAEGEVHGDRPTDLMLLLVRATSLTDATRLALDNPVVKSGILKGSVQSWNLGLSTVRSKARVQSAVISTKSFRIESLDPEAPIVLKATEQQ